MKNTKTLQALHPYDASVFFEHCHALSWVYIFLWMLLLEYFLAAVLGGLQLKLSMYFRMSATYLAMMQHCCISFDYYRVY